VEISNISQCLKCEGGSPARTVAKSEQDCDKFLLKRRLERLPTIAGEGARAPSNALSLKL
jgi:hypothetical protein